jgi:hypothetical protein
MVKQPALGGLRALTLMGGLTPEDGAALGRSPHLRELRSLTFWLGGEDDEAVSPALARLPALAELVLVQRVGGIFHVNGDDLNRRSDALVALVNEACGKPIARVERPFARLFPLDGRNIGHGYYAGRLPGGRPVLVVQDGLSKQPQLIQFDADGHVMLEEDLDLREKLVKPPPHPHEEVKEEELLEVLAREVGFTPGPIFVREFDSQIPGINLTDNLDIGGRPDSRFDCEYEYWLWRSGQFLLADGNYWLDSRGHIHST